MNLAWNRILQEPFLYTNLRTLHHILGLYQHRVSLDSAQVVMDTRRDETKRDETKRDETKRDETKRDETKRDETLNSSCSTPQIKPRKPETREKSW
ncbi:uncharacterized protein LAJ45_05379 [Morchella importuna]|uniref:uncharacterized protein n=1 Tax=Morchella importuna TaxID=1174673 RepID=UPI001E8E455F|nr:uncharacterized protein LAJ45_05379 [Morchella importuna]KAH8150683.1 hypothetical protein LAJ45_05379 [Morchella importuna]